MITERTSVAEASNEPPKDPYLSLLRRAITASIYPESAWRMVRPDGRKGVSGALQAAFVRFLAKRGFRLINALPFDAKRREVGLDWPMFGYSMIGHKRLENIEACIRSVVSDGIEGDFVECGVWRGGASIYAKGVLNALGETGRTVWLADSFEGMPAQAEEDKVDIELSQFTILAVSQEQVEDNFRQFGFLDDRVRFIKGWFSDSLPTCPVGKIALLRLDGDYYSSTMDALNGLYDRVVSGGYILVDDYGAFESCRRAITEFLASRGVDPKIIPVDYSGVYWRKA